MTLQPHRSRGPWRALGRLAARSLVAFAIAVVIAWIVGRLLSDRLAWSQWLFWIPTPAAMLAAALGWSISRCCRAERPRAPRRRRPRRWLWPAILAITAITFLLIEHRLLHRAAPIPPRDGSLKLMHWNMGHWKRRLIPHMAGLVMDFQADVSIITDGGGIGGDPSLKEWLGEDSPPRTLHPFTILTRRPIVELRPLVFADDIAVGLLVLDTNAALGRDLCVYMVDLPSALKLGRWEIADRARRLIAEAQAAGAPLPDIMVGDFNMTRGGAALDRLAAGLDHAWSQGGHGCGASFPRGFALYHIDHLFVAPWLRCERYELVDAGMGRHRAQAAWVSARP